MRTALVIIGVTCSGCHWCADETALVISTIGSVGLLAPWLKARWVGICVKLSKKHDCHDKGCDK